MGCAESKLENEDTVRQCKERRRLMKEAVYARHHLAVAHSDYCRSLRIIGSALVTFASGEPLSVSHHAPAVLLRAPSTASAVASNYKPSTFISPPRPPSLTAETSIRSPPPPPMSEHQKPQPPPAVRRKKAMKLPHILSESSSASSPPLNRDFTYGANLAYSSTPSQASSAWNWDNIYAPPSPPDSEYFEQLQNNKNTTARIDRSNLDDDRSTRMDSDDKSSIRTSHSDAQNPGDLGRNLFGNNHSKQLNDRASNYSLQSRCSDSRYAKNYARQVVAKAQKREQNINSWEREEETQREELECPEWGDHDHYSSASCSSADSEMEDPKSRSDYWARSNFGYVKHEAAVPAGEGNAYVNSKFPSKFEKPPPENDRKSSVGWEHKDREKVNSNQRIAVRHKDLAEIVAALNEYFSKASSAGEQLSEILEIGRAQFNRSFKQLRKTIYHSTGILSNLSSSSKSKPPLAVKYRFEPCSIKQSGGSKSLCSTLEQLLAREKKLYHEVKAWRRAKIKHKKKVSSFQTQEYHGRKDTKLDKTKASINKLQSLIIVTSQAVSATSSTTISLRDSDLVPQLVERCHGFMYMWRSMHQFHEAQRDIVQQVWGLVNNANKGITISDLHRQATRDLESAVSAWHSSFCSLIKFQRDFIHSLHGWFKLTPVPIDVNTEPTRGKRDEVFAFCDEWKLALDRASDTVASESIKSFSNVVHSIILKQVEEQKIKKQSETVSKELEKKASSLRSMERKYYHSYSTAGIGLPNSGLDNRNILDSRDPLSEKKVELVTCLRRVEDEMLKHSKAVDVTRAMTLNNIQTGLPGVFQAMTSFSVLMAEALETVCTCSYAI